VHVHGENNCSTHLVNLRWSVSQLHSIWPIVQHLVNRTVHLQYY